MHRRGFFGALLAGVAALCGVRPKADDVFFRRFRRYGTNTPLLVRTVEPGTIIHIPPGRTMVYLGLKPVGYIPTADDLDFSGAGPDADAPA